MILADSSAGAPTTHGITPTVDQRVATKKAAFLRHLRNQVCTMRYYNTAKPYLEGLGSRLGFAFAGRFAFNGACFLGGVFSIRRSTSSSRDRGFGMAKKVLNAFTWPKPNKSIEAALGRFIIAWNVVEQQMDFAIEEMTGLDHDLAMSVTANLGTQAKLDMYQALAHSMVSVLGEGVRDEIDKLAGQTSNASGELRNFIVHGQPFKIMTPKGKLEIWARFSARKGGVKGRFVRWNGPYIEKRVTQIKTLADKWQAVRAKAFKELDLWRSMPDDLREDAPDEVF